MMMIEEFFDDLQQDQIIFENEFDTLLQDIMEREEDEHPSSSCDLSSSGSVNEEKRNRVKKIRNRRTKSRNPMYMPNLRILRRDIRRRYSEMFSYALNSREGSLIVKFFTEFAIPTCIVETKFMQEKLNFIPFPLRPPTRSIGPGAVVNGITRNHDIIPDMIFRYKDCQVRVGTGYTGSIVQAHFICEGNRMYCVDEVDSQVNQPIDAISYNRDGLKWTLLPSPVKVRIENLVTMRLDENHVIVNFSLECKHFEERVSS